MASSPGLPDTPAASSETRFVPISDPVDNTWQPPASPALSSPRFGRSQSLAHPALVARKPIRRKPLSTTASALAMCFLSQGPLGIAVGHARPEQRFSRACSVDSPTLYEFPGQVLNTVVTPVTPSSSSSSSASLSSSSSSSSSSPPLSAWRPTSRSVPGPLKLPSRGGDEALESSAPAGHETRSIPPCHPVSTRADPTATDSQLESLCFEIANSSFASPATDTTRSQYMSLSIRKAAPPHLTLGPSYNNTRTTAHLVSATSGLELDINKPLPSSPSKLSGFFGWAYSPVSTELSGDEENLFPQTSPRSTEPTPGLTDKDPASAYQPQLSPHTNTSTGSSGTYPAKYLKIPANSTTPLPVQIEEMEDELKAISAELVSSIRREMDLEDLVERLQEQFNNPQAPGRRTSDYYSDSGFSSAKLSDYDHAKEEISQIQRRAQREQARIRVELMEKLQDERTMRRDLDVQIQELSKRASQMDAAQIQHSNVSDRVRELEAQCQELRRQVSEERKSKENFEDFLVALKKELEDAANERDNLRDEVVPSLRARLEGLEAEAADSTKYAYDATKLQQQVQNLKEQNSELKKSASRTSVGLSRSAFIDRSAPLKRNRPKSLVRSSTVKQSEPRDVLADRLRDVEAQRDALHNALKSLLDRQEYQNRENEKKIKLLEQERDRLLSVSPRKPGFEREVTHLREEIILLRRRAEEALEQKWRVEKGLAGLKMDLDRAENEVASLRDLLSEKDGLMPPSIARLRDSSGRLTGPATSESLEVAYREVQNAYSEALARIQALESSSRGDEKTKLAMDRLEQSLATAIAERDVTRSEVDGLRSQVARFQTWEKTHLQTERDLADQLREAAQRIEELAQQVRSQLASNALLRDRITEAVDRGESEQRVSKQRIAAMQSRLHALEEQLVATQTAAEERVARHEEEIRNLTDAHKAQIQRLRDGSGGLRSPRPLPTKGGLLSPLSPRYASLGSGARSPSVSEHPGSSGSALLSPPPDGSSTSSAPSCSQPAVSGAAEADSVAALKTRIAALEEALVDADSQMQEVVSIMNKAQIEVLQLQEEREEAVRETRRLQKIMAQEKALALENGLWALATRLE